MFCNFSPKYQNNIKRRVLFFIWIDIKEVSYEFPNHPNISHSHFTGFHLNRGICGTTHRHYFTIWLLKNVMHFPSYGMEWKEGRKDALWPTESGGIIENPTAKSCRSISRESRNNGEITNSLNRYVRFFTLHRCHKRWHLPRFFA